MVAIKEAGGKRCLVINIIARQTSRNRYSGDIKFFSEKRLITNVSLLDQ